ncbi:HK97-gp10 family putative phage morphogenesis protein [Paludibacterium denitrificans]|uniref:Phage protein, HK97 gp10 family n=1 Tax=Paludibacterium denitrificans TaxID=2675226 RepID=A0A844GFN4_9NEIS|nr:HK97-gp10 family putative phage morphogenesis protein [Paludibacterium denitrificans]MTD34091.1 hypothetical protein [Paludibacterium denitrificans]
MADVELQIDPRAGELFIRLHGISSVLDDRRALSKPLLSGMRIIQRRAKADAPKDTGFLRSQIIAWTNVRSSDPLTGFVTVATRAKRSRNGTLKNARLSAKRSTGRKVDVVTAFYGQFQEKGTSKMPAHAFLSPAVEEVGEQAREQVAAEVQATMLKLVGERLANL